MRLFLYVIGLMMVVEGLPYFAFPEKMRLWLRMLLETPDRTLRRLGFGLMAFGVFLVYIGSRA